MRVLVVHCPVCGEELHFSEADLQELPVGDIIGCGACHTEMEITQNDGELFDLAVLEPHTLCPQCGEEVLLSDEILDREEATCPHCTHTFRLIWD